MKKYFFTIIGLCLLLAGNIIAGENNWSRVKEINVSFTVRGNIKKPTCIINANTKNINHVNKSLAGSGNHQDFDLEFSCTDTTNIKVTYQKDNRVLENGDQIITNIKGLKLKLNFSDNKPKLLTVTPIGNNIQNSGPFSSKLNVVITYS